MPAAEAAGKLLWPSWPRRGPASRVATKASKQQSEQQRFLRGIGADLFEPFALRGFTSISVPMQGQVLRLTIAVSVWGMVLVQVSCALLVGPLP